MTQAADSIRLFDMDISRIDFEGVAAMVDARIASREPGYIVTPNVDHVCLFHREPELRAAYAEASLVLPDGTPIIWASHLLGSPLPQKLSGSDLVPGLCKVAAERGYSVFFLGGTEGAAEESAAKLCKKWPALNVAGVHWPPYGFERDPAQNAETVAVLQAARPDICFVAFGTPKQELWLHRHYQELGIPVCIGVGGSFELVSGRVARAPRMVQSMGLEWLWRLAHEPRRLWRRYLVDDLVFFKLFWHEFRRRRTGQSQSVG
jgi:N-acetylglucosaminyldiphosphoundecaprenol N-acetyl-beta-D-mannosaminyltransferase